MLCQILKQNGASRVVLAANKGKKIDIARENEIADAYVEFDKANPQAAWETIKQEYPYGFDAVVSTFLPFL
jgi:D-arabinitol dehydrogenase (NADP+)